MPDCACRIQTPVYTQMFEFVLATLFHIHQSVRMSFVFQMYLQAYVLCLNINMQLCVDRVPEDVFTWIPLKYTGSGEITGQVGIHMLHCLFIYLRKINVF